MVWKGGRVDVHELTALELADAVRGREISPVEVAQHFVARAEALDERFGVFVTRTPERALEQAAEVERRVMTSEPGDLPVFVGVPCPIKDLDQVAGVRHTMGSAAFQDNIAQVDDGIVDRLRAAGTLMLGKTTTPEFGLPCYTESKVAPPARTPWDWTRSAGGSSGGAAAAVAAGIAPIAQGSDGGGSLRIPASATGLVGLKPSRGRVSPGPYGVDLGLASLGGLTRDVESTAALLDLISQPWPGDTTLLPPPTESFLAATARDPAPLHIGLLTDPVIAADATVHPACRQAAEETAGLLTDLGHDVTPTPVPFPAERWGAFATLWAALAASVPVPESGEADLMPLTRWLRETGRHATAVEYVRSQAASQFLARETAAAWSGLDIVLSPTLADLPARVGALRDDSDPEADFLAQTRFTPWTSVWNLVGAPAISLPLGWHVQPSDDSEDSSARTQRTLPVGVMLGAAVGREELLLSLAGQLQRAAPWRDRSPVLDDLPATGRRKSRITQGSTSSSVPDEL